MIPTLPPPAAGGLENARPRATQPDPQSDPLRAVAEKLEASFLSEMLKSAGFGKAQESFGGGVGEEQFSSFLRDAEAREMARGGGIGLAESLFEALKERSDAAR
jgi:Rod binding domain-containing protein